MHKSPPMSSNRLRELVLGKWRGLASKAERKRSNRGHFVVYAKGGKRFVVPLRYLDHPIFRVLLEMAEEEFGTAAGGPLRVPCEEELVEHAISLMRSSPVDGDVEKALLSMGWSCRGASSLAFFPLSAMH